MARNEGQINLFEWLSFTISGRIWLHLNINFYEVIKKYNLQNPLGIDVYGKFGEHILDEDITFDNKIEIQSD